MATQLDSKTVKIIDRNDFYNANGEDAEFIAQSILKSKTCLKQGDGNQVYITLTKGQFEQVLRELVLSFGYCVEIYSGSGGRANFSEQNRQAKVSPGNFGDYEDLLIGSGSQSQTASPIVGAVKVAMHQGSLSFGVAAIDVNTRRMTCLEVCDDEKMASLETVLVQLGIRELLACQGDPHTEKIFDLCLLSNIHLSYRKKSDFVAKDLDQDLNKLIRFPKGAVKNSAILPEIKMELAMQSLSATIKFLDLLNQDMNHALFTLETFDPQLFMKIDSSAVVALGLTPKPGEAQSAFGSLFAILNHCRTQSGQRLLLQWIKQPLIDLDSINRRLDLVELFVLNHELRRNFHDTHLRGVQDLQRLGKKFVSKKSTLVDMYKVYQTVQRLPKMLELLTGDDDIGRNSAVQSELAGPLREAISDFEKYQDLIEATVDFDYFASHREFRVKPDFDEGLGEKCGVLDDLEDKANEELQECINTLGVDNVKLEVSSQGGFAFRVTFKDEHYLRDKRQYSIVDSSKGAGVRFRNKQLAALSEDYVDTQSVSSVSKFNSSRDLEKGSELGFLVIANNGGYSQPMLDLASLLSTIDVYISLAVAATGAPIPYVRPKLLPLGSGKLELKGVRHPCVEAQLTSSTFIANDITFSRGDGASSSPSFYVITGPNMGGKSTFLRSVALASLMAQIGSFVAADEAELAIVDAILARVGASDCIVRGVSTFMSEMLDTAVILEKATCNSLVIIDELGRGTSTYDGFGLAWAVSEHLVTETGCFVLFATHFHELTRLESSYPNKVLNLHVSTYCDENMASDSALTFLYKLKPGPCGKSLGLQVAKMVNFPDEVLATASEWASGLAVADGAAQTAGFTVQEVEDAEQKFDGFLEKVKSLEVDDMSNFKKLRDKLTQEALEGDGGNGVNHFLQWLVRTSNTNFADSA